jgi:hypothetical protein
MKNTMSIFAIFISNMVLECADVTAAENVDEPYHEAIRQSALEKNAEEYEILEATEQSLLVQNLADFQDQELIMAMMESRKSFREQEELEKAIALSLQDNTAINQVESPINDEFQKAVAFSKTLSDNNKKDLNNITEEKRMNIHEAIKKASNEIFDHFSDYQDLLKQIHSLEQSQDKYEESGQVELHHKLLADAEKNKAFLYKAYDIQNSLKNIDYVGIVKNIVPSLNDDEANKLLEELGYYI